jgi:hypothetical protein
MSSIHAKQQHNCTQATCAAAAAGHAAAAWLPAIDLHSPLHVGLQVLLKDSARVEQRATLLAASRTTTATLSHFVLECPATSALRDAMFAE